jgi:hypothetical protein
MRRIRRHVSYANVAATLALVLAMSGAGYAASGGFTSGGKLQACVNSEGRLRLMKPGKRCGKGQQPVAWNQQGPPGQPGAKGASGSAGATGATGPMGLPGASGQPSNVMWAQINKDGVIEAGHGATEVEDEGKAPYTVTFEKDLEHCAVVATQNGVQTQSAVAAVKTEESLGNQAQVWIVNKEKEVAAGFSIIAVC